MPSALSAPGRSTGPAPIQLLFARRPHVLLRGADFLFFLVVGCCTGLLRKHDPRSRVGGLLQGVLAGWFGGCAFFTKVLIMFVREDAVYSPWLYIFGILTFGCELS